MIPIMKVNKAIIFFLLISQAANLNAQVYNDSGSVKFILDTALNKEIKNSKVHITQGNRILKADLNEYIKVKLGAEFSADFINTDLMIKGFKRLKIFADTSILLGATSMTEVVVKTKKKLITENTIGFDYYPQNDSLLREKSILMGLQRLPFINGYDELSVPKYRQNGKILFTINGKQRPGIGNNWASVLGIIKGKDVYKVELIEDLPIQIKNQGYAAMINILTVDANIYGKSFNAVLFYDQRNNINTSASATFLRKRFDITLNTGRDEDNQNGRRKTKVFAQNILQSALEIQSRYIFETKYANMAIGFRKDSLRDFGLNISARTPAYSTKFTPTYQFGINTLGITNNFDKENLRVDFSYISIKKKGITSSIAAAANFAKKLKVITCPFTLPSKETALPYAQPQMNCIGWPSTIYKIPEKKNIPKNSALRFITGTFHKILRDIVWKMTAMSPGNYYTINRIFS